MRRLYLFVFSFCATLFYGQEPLFSQSASSQNEFLIMVADELPSLTLIDPYLVSKDFRTLLTDRPNDPNTSTVTTVTVSVAESPILFADTLCSGYGFVSTSRRVVFKQCAVAFGRGFAEKLTVEEFSAVMAHEIGHIMLRYRGVDIREGRMSRLFRFLLLQREGLLEKREREADMFAVRILKQCGIDPLVLVSALMLDSVGEKRSFVSESALDTFTARRIQNIKKAIKKLDKNQKITHASNLF